MGSFPEHLDLRAHLATVHPSEKHNQLHSSVLPTLLQSIGGVAHALQSTQGVSQIGTSNAFGDDQLNVDVIAEDIIRAAIAQCPSIYTASSEEDPVEKATRVGSRPSDETAEEKYTVAFDPLDGSSIIAPNWTVGTIIGIWEGLSALNQHPSKQIGAILGVCGPRTTAIVALRIPGEVETCFEVSLDKGSGSSLTVIRPDIRFSEGPFKTRYFAPANLRAAAEDAKYLKLVNHFITEKYTLRYSGGLVPDIAHTLVKGHGVYVSPVTAASKAKLRRLYELAPIALIVQCAGGLAIDSGDGADILARQIKDTDERAGLVCGSRDEVEQVKKALID